LQQHDELTLVGVLGPNRFICDEQEGEEEEDEPTIGVVASEAPPFPELAGDIVAPAPLDAAEAARAPEVLQPILPSARVTTMQADCFAEDVQLVTGMDSWTDEQLLAYFESGGEDRPA